jgi:tRNA U34 2-thiouridine synthase MnmA/TrmU
MSTKYIKALVLVSGGLDSALAAKLVKNQGIDLTAVHFASPFWGNEKKYPARIAEKLNIPFKNIPLRQDYLKMLRNPKHGYGSAVNPCIDCHAFMFRKAWEMGKKMGVKFLVTGEVLGQRPMSQRLPALRIVEKEAGLVGKILRPLSAKLLAETEPEKKGWVDRQKLLSIEGRSRKPQLAIAGEFSVNDYACAAGGCLLTMEQFAKKLKDLFQRKKHITWNEIKLLKFGRHFRYQQNRIIVGRDHGENEALRKLKPKEDYLFMVPIIGSPITILQGPKTKTAIRLAARLTARYSDSKAKRVTVKYGRTKPAQEIIVSPAPQPLAARLNLSL